MPPTAAPALSLDTVVEEALERNPEIAAMARQFDAMRAKIPQAKAWPEPMVEVASMGNIVPFSVQRDDPSSNRMLSVKQEIMWPGKLSLMGKMAGVYYGERPSPDGQYINYQYRSLEPDGLFQYQDQTCGNVAGIPCSQNQGTGEWRAVTRKDGTIYMMMRFSDLIVTSACAGGRYRMDGSALVDEFGITWQRVQ